MSDEDLKKVVREFRASVAELLDDTERRLRADLREGFDRQRNDRGTADVAWANERRDSEQRWAARFEAVERRLTALEGR